MEEEEGNESDSELTQHQHTANDQVTHQAVPIVEIEDNDDDAEDGEKSERRRRKGDFRCSERVTTRR